MSQDSEPGPSAPTPLERPPPSRQVGPRSWAVGLVLATLLSLVAGSIGFVHDLTSAGTPDFQPEDLRIRTGQEVTASLILDSLSLPEKRLSATLYLTIPYYNHGLQTVTFDLDTASLSFHWDRSITVKTLESAPSWKGNEEHYARAFHLTIPLAGSSDAFPQDSYSMDLQALESYSFRTPVQTGSAIRDLQYQVVPGTVAEEYTVKVTPSLGRFGRLPIHLPNGQPVPAPMALGSSPLFGDNVTSERITMARRGDNQAYVYSVALIPMLVFLVYVHLLFLNPRYRGVDLPDLMAGLFAATLAILPLHLILVPSEIVGRTRVDDVLAIGLFLIVASAVCRYAWDLWRGRVQPEE